MRMYSIKEKLRKKETGNVIVRYKVQFALIIQVQIKNCSLVSS